MGVSLVSVSAVSHVDVGGDGGCCHEYFQESSTQMPGDWVIHLVTPFLPLGASPPLLFPTTWLLLPAGNKGTPDFRGGSRAGLARGGDC